MAANKIKDFLTDEEMAAIESGRTPDFISDEEMGKMEGSGLPQPSQPTGIFGGIKLDLAKRGQNMMQNVEEMKQYGKGGALNRTIAGAEYGLRQAGELGGSVGDIVGRLASPITKPIFEKAIKPTAKAIIGEENIPTVKEGIGYFAQDIGKFQQAHPRLSKDIGAALEAMELIPAGWGAGQASKQTGKALIKGGESSLKSAMKVKDVTAKLAGPNVEAGVEKIVSDVRKFNLESPVGGFKGIAQKAQKTINSEMAKSDKLLDDYVKLNPTANIDVDNLFLTFMDDLEKGRELSVFKNETKASNIAGDIHKALDLRGLAGTQPVSNLPKMKHTISEGMDLFKKGKYNVPKDPLEQKVGELAYLNLKKDLEGFVPELKVTNQNVHDLINVNTAALEAKKRIGNKDKIGLTDWMVLLGGPSAAASIGVPQHFIPIAATAGGAMMAKKILSGGRGSSALIKTGKFLGGEKKNSMTKNINKSMALPLKSEPGDFMKGINIEKASKGMPNQIPESKKSPLSLEEYENNLKKYIDYFKGIDYYYDKNKGAFFKGGPSDRQGRGIGGIETPGDRPEFALGGEANIIEGERPYEAFSRQQELKGRGESGSGGSGDKGKTSPDVEQRGSPEDASGTSPAPDITVVKYTPENKEWLKGLSQSDWESLFSKNSTVDISKAPLEVQKEIIRIRNSNR